MVNYLGLLTSKEARTRGSAQAPTKNTVLTIAQCERKMKKIEEEKKMWRDARRIVIGTAMFAAYTHS